MRLVMAAAAVAALASCATPEGTPPNAAAFMQMNCAQLAQKQYNTQIPFGMSGTMCAIWFGILVVKMAEFCLITPPIGLNCFVVAGVQPDISVQDVFRGVTPFFVADGVTIALLVAFPSIVLWLPSLAG